jgi:hypothetical protein
MTETVSVILLPFFMVLVFCSILGVKPDIIVKLFTDILVVLIRGLTVVLAAIFKGLVEATELLIMAKLMSRQQPGNFQQAPKRSKVKVSVMDDGDSQ